MRKVVTRRAKRQIELRDAYARFVASDDGKLILPDLAKVCLFKSPYPDNDSEIRLARNVGRGEVFTHIQTRAALTDRQIMNMLEIDDSAAQTAALLDAVDQDEGRIP